MRPGPRSLVARCFQRGKCSRNTMRNKHYESCNNPTSPKVVVAVSWKVTATVVEPVPVPLPVAVPPLPRAPVCMAIALRAGTVAVNVPPLTVILQTYVQRRKYSRGRCTHENPVQVPDELAPLMTSQYDPLGNEVVKVAVQVESTLLIATKPRAP